jgi:Cu2+-exporting ATPase
VTIAAERPRAAPSLCAHCGLPAAPDSRFCCAGCEAAFAVIGGLGLDRYYRDRVLDPAARPPRPEPGERPDLGRFVTVATDGSAALGLLVEGVQCGACVWLIEAVLARDKRILEGRVNMTTRRLRLRWRGDPALAAELVASIERLGYRLVPFDASRAQRESDRRLAELLRALAVAGFAAGNLMLLSIGIWAGLSQGMGEATRTLMHWISAAIALPAVAYAGRPFFRSALNALRHGRTNMDVPISVGVVLVTAMSLAETIRGEQHAYFDSSTTLLFFLLVGRVLDHRARGRVRHAAEQLLGLKSSRVTVLASDGTAIARAPESVLPDERVIVGMGERVGIDGLVLAGQSSVDASLVTGESLPVPVEPGACIFAGSINLGGPLTLCVTASGESTLLAECVKLIEAAEQGGGRFVSLAERVARYYAPVVHLAALSTFLYWWGVAGMAWTGAVLNATAVLIITCPCALGLAVPAVQVIATGRLFRAGTLLKSPTALERLAAVDTVVFDKTGTLTEPGMALVRDGSWPDEALAEAAALAARSRHPLARALVAAAGAVVPAENVAEIAGEGVRRRGALGEVRLGSRKFAGIVVAEPATGPELWLTRPASRPLRFRFAERLRDDAAATVAALRADGQGIRLLSGDRVEPVTSAAAAAGIEDWRAGLSPVAKAAALETMAAAGHTVLMVGDGLNDGPALAVATVSMSPSTAADVSQTIADVVFQGRHLAPVVATLRIARRARRLMQQNLAVSLGYNLVMVPLAVLGYVTPWLAAAAMSGSSLIVIANSFRFGREETP